jgi:hypothetical protein
MPATVTDRVFGESSSVAVKAPCRSVSTTNITLSGLQTISGVSLAEGDRVLVLAQTDAKQNGIYNVSSSAWTRTGDFDGNRDVVQGTRVLVALPGSSLASEYELTSANPIIIGTSSITFALRYGANATYDRTTAEISSGVTPVNYAYPPGDLRRYGCDVTGATDNSTQISNAILAAVASGGTGYIYHPGGTISHASQIVVPNGLTIVGYSRVSCIFQFTGSPSGSPVYTRSAWRYANGPNGSGYANIAFRHVKILYQNTVNFAAAIEFNAGGWSYFEIDDVWIRGNCSYGVILDGVEVGSVHNCLIENLNATANYNIWIVNGGDRVTAQTAGFTNVISIRENQISAGTDSIGLVDDGGNAHVVQGNNFNQHRIPATFSGAQGIKLGGNSFETTLTTGPANVYFGFATQAGVPIGPCTGFEITANGFFGGMSSGSLLTFGGSQNTITAITKASSAVVTVSTGGATNPFGPILGSFVLFSGVAGMTQINGLAGQVTALGGSTGAWTVTVAINSSGFGVYSSAGVAQLMHSGGFVKGNNFGSEFGRGGAIDVTYLANSECSSNTDYGNASMSHYVGTHADSSGNTLLPPQIGFLPTLGVNGAYYGDTRYRSAFGAAVQVGYLVVAYSSSVTFDAGAANIFDITATNGTAFTINSPSNVTGGNEFAVTIRNTSGVALGAITWGTSFKLAGAWISPATGNNRSIKFITDASGVCHELCRSAADVAN